MKKAEAVRSVARPGGQAPEGSSDDGIYGQSPAGALSAALNAYQKWLSDLEGPGCLGVDTGVGIAQLHKVLDILGEAFPPLLGQKGTQLLLAHALLADLVKERQVRALRGLPTWPTADRGGSARLMQEQRAAIEALLQAVAAWPFVPRDNASGRVDELPAELGNHERLRPSRPLRDTHPGKSSIAQPFKLRAIADAKLKPAVDALSGGTSRKRLRPAP